MLKVDVNLFIYSLHEYNSQNFSNFHIFIVHIFKSEKNSKIHVAIDLY